MGTCGSLSSVSGLADYICFYRQGGTQGILCFRKGKQYRSSSSALRNHSAAILGVLPAIDNLPPGQNVSNKEVTCHLSGLDLFHCIDHHVDGERPGKQHAVDLPCSAADIIGILDDEEVDVAVGTGSAPCMRTKQKDSLRMKGSRDLQNDFLQ